MRRQTENDAVSRNPMKSKTESPGKKAYHSPRLVVYGDLHALTRGGTRNHNEAGDNTGVLTHIG